MTDGWELVEWMRAIGWSAGLFFVGTSFGFWIAARRVKQTAEDMKIDFEQRLVELGRRHVRDGTSE